MQLDVRSLQYGRLSKGASDERGEERVVRFRHTDVADNAGVEESTGTELDGFYFSENVSIVREGWILPLWLVLFLSWTVSIEKLKK